MTHTLSNALEHLYALLVDSLVDDRDIKNNRQSTLSDC